MVEPDGGRMVPRWNVERWIGVITLVVSIAAFVFGLGVNWARITGLEARQHEAERTFLRADVYTSDQRRLSESVDRLTRAIEQLQAQQRQSPPRDAPGRMFDR